MSSTTQKQRNFVSEPMGEKNVKELPGIGKVLGQRLSDQGYGKANAVLGKYLVLDKDEGRFTDWLKDTSKANAKQAGDCHRTLSTWCDEFL